MCINFHVSETEKELIEKRIDLQKADNGAETKKEEE